MNGATAEPPPITIKTPNRSKTKITGSSQNFFRSLMKLNRSVKKSICLFFVLYYLIDSRSKFGTSFRLIKCKLFFPVVGFLPVELFGFSEDEIIDH